MTESDEIYARLKANQTALEAAIRRVPGWEDFNGTPESAVGAAVSIIDKYATASRARDIRVEVEGRCQGMLSPTDRDAVEQVIVGIIAEAVKHR